MANILMIDDDKQLLKMMGMMLERGGHNPTLISDPEEGMVELQENKPDLLVLDVMMPGTNGHLICRQIRATKELADLPILILTARAQDVDREAALKSGADEYLSKPVSAQELMQSIDQLLRQKTPQVAAKEPALVISVFGLRGGVGRTTLAVNLAAALRRWSQKETCLFDLATSGGQANAHLRLPAKTTWADLPVGGELVWEILAKRLLLHQSGLRVLAAPAGPRSPDALSPSLVTAVIDTLRTSAAFTVLDLPAIYSAATVAALQASDLVFHVVQAEVIAVQMALQANRALANLEPGIKQSIYLLNQTSSESLLPVKAVERGLNSRLPLQIGHDNHQARALAQGVPLALTAAQSALPSGIGRVVNLIKQHSNSEVVVA